MRNFFKPDEMESDELDSDLEIQVDAENGVAAVMFIGFGGGGDGPGDGVADPGDRDMIPLSEDSTVDFEPSNDEDNDSDGNDDDESIYTADETDDDEDGDINLNDAGASTNLTDRSNSRGRRQSEQGNSVNNNGGRAEGSATTERNKQNDEEQGEEEEEDDVIKAIIANTKTSRTHPPDISIDDFVVDLSFHPDEDILAAATMSGDAIIYKYSVDENILVNTLELHTKAIRDIEFSLDGSTLYSASKDKSIALTDLNTGKFKRLYEQAHQQPVSTMSVLDENLFATGDDDGTIKVWDIRQRGSDPIFSLKEVDDYITSLLTNDAKKVLLATSGDGFLTAISISARKLYVQSEPYDEELTCMGLFRNDSKVVVGTSKGRLYTFDWDKFGYHSNVYPGPKSPMSLMLPVTDRVAVVAGEEGILRALHCVPGRNLGVVGQHSLAVDAMDINHSGEYIASTSDNNEIKFWNIKYFEDLDNFKYNDKQNKYKEQKHNLPSSKCANAGDFFSDLL